MNKMDQPQVNRPPVIRANREIEKLEKAAQLKGVLSQDQLCTIADALMRSYQIFRGNRIEQDKIKKMLELAVAACPNARHYLDDDIE
jgi:hypothetical protein